MASCSTGRRRASASDGDTRQALEAASAGDRAATQAKGRAGRWDALLGFEEGSSIFSSFLFPFKILDAKVFIK